MSPAEFSLETLLAGSQEPLAVTDRGPVRVLIFNRPAARNALSVAVRQAFAREAQEAEADPAVKALIVTGAGGAFSAGVDLKEAAAGPRPLVRPNPGEVLRAMTKPSIAAVDGPCVTGALEIALSCSFIIASDRARFADTHAKVRLFPAWGMSALLPRAIGVRRARQMTLTGEFIDAGTALSWGLVNEVTTPDALLPRCAELAEAILGCDEASARAQLALLNRTEAAPLADALAAEAEALGRWREARGAPASKS